VLVDMPCAAFHEANKADGGLRAYFRDVVAPQLPECVRGPFLDANATQEPQCMGCRPLNSAPPQKPGAILLGDAWNVRHPLTGGGMTVALKDSEAVAAALGGVHFGTASDYAIAAAIRGFQERRASHAATINVLANALHKVFTRPLGDPRDGTRSRLRAACIDYLSLGGAHTAGPVGLLSGLTPRPEVLVAHFFWVAVHAMRHAVVPYPTPGRLRKGYDLLHVACCIIMPLLAAERVTLLANPLVAGVTDLVFPWKKSPLAE
jgi:squalene monooxygenase